MATLPYFQNAGRPDVSLDDLLRMTALFDSQQIGTGDAMEFVRNQNPYGYSQRTDNGMLAMYDPQGKYLGDDKPEQMELLDKIIAGIVLAGGGAVVGNALGLVGGGGGLGSDALLGGADVVGGATGSGGLEAAASTGLSSADKAALFGSSGYGPGMSGAATGAFDSVLSATGSTGLANMAGNVAQAAGGIPWNTIGQIGMGVLGAADARNDTNTAQTSNTREPWAAAQPLLKSLLGQGQTLADRYAQQPFSQAQQTAYNNVGGLLNAINGGASGLLGGAMANAAGTNNFDRSNPRRQLTGSSFNLSQFAPGLLNFFGGGK